MKEIHCQLVIEYIPEEIKTEGKSDIIRISLSDPAEEVLQVVSVACDEFITEQLCENFREDMQEAGMYWVELQLSIEDNGEYEVRPGVKAKSKTLGLKANSIAYKRLNAYSDMEFIFKVFFTPSQVERCFPELTERTLQ